MEGNDPQIALFVVFFALQPKTEKSSIPMQSNFKAPSCFMIVGACTTIYYIYIYYIYTSTMITIHESETPIDQPFFGECPIVC